MNITIKNTTFYFLFLMLLFSCSTTEKILTESSREKLSEKQLKNKYANLLGVSPEQIENIALYTFINEWYGTPYKYAGKSKEGIDCSGFTSILLKEVYEKILNGPSNYMFEVCEKISNSDLQEGDIVFFKINSKNISHVGVYLQNKKFVHASTKKGVIVSSLNEEYYKNAYYKAGRVK